MSNSKSSIPAALTLFFLAPLVAEFLLGDLPVTLLPALIMLAPMYGGGALLIRELTRRSGRGWPTMLLLGCAYTLIEEGFATQSLFNRNFLGMHLLEHAWIPSLGVGAWWTILMFNVHPLWSMGVPIALSEGLFPWRGRAPWLGKTGVCVAAILFVAGVIANGAFSYHQSHFRASTVQFLVTALFSILFVVAAFLLPSPPLRATAGEVPSPWLAGSAAFLFGILAFFTPPQWNWGAFAFIAAVDLVSLSSLWVIARRSGWTLLHTLSLGAGGAVFYGLHAFLQNSVVPSHRWLVRFGNALFLVLAIAVIVIATRRTRSALRVGSAQTTPSGPPVL